MPQDIKAFRSEQGGDLEKLRESQAARDPKSLHLIDEVITTDQEWRKVEFDKRQITTQLNKLSGEFAKKKRANEDTSELTEQIKALKEQQKKLEEDEIVLVQSVKNKISMIGNFVDPTVPRSMNEDDNLVVATWGECKRDPDVHKYHHHELLWMIDGYSPEPGARVAGHRGYFLKGYGVLLNQALIQYGLKFLMQKKYTPIQPPFMMRKDIMAATAQLSDFDETLYKVSGDSEEMYLIATSEQPISAYHMGEHLDDEQLPLRYAGVSSCFRKEAGSYGRDAWGIFRVHQFEKIEQFCITSPEKSCEMHDEMIQIAQDFYQSLGFAYRVVNIVSGALNNAAAKKYDLEAWFPTLGLYRELVSASNCTDYQSRAMETRYGFSNKAAGHKEKQYVHMLNATLCATERTMCCILENGQTDKGIVLPKPLADIIGVDIIPYVKEPPKNVNKEKSAKGAKKEEAKTSQ